MADFSYFDQFGTMEIDLTSYLQSVTISGSNYTFSNIQPVVTTITNLFSKYDIVFDYKKNVDLILNYQIQDNEFIETVSYNTYGSTDYWWIVALFNNIYEPFNDWPLSHSEVVQVATNLYNNERKFTYSTYFNFVSANNDLKRNIILPKNDVVNDIIWDYRQAILGNK